MYQCGFLLVMLLLVGCKEEISHPARVDLPNERPVATVYRISASEGKAGCLRSPDLSAESVVTLNNGQLVDLVSLAEGTLKHGNEYWLHVYPRLGQRPSCYINIRNLMPAP